MTKRGSFKRAARERARATGRRYTEALADLETARRQAFVRARPVEHDALRAHLEAEYGIRVASLAPIDDDPATRPRGSWPGHYPGTLLVRREDGTPWIARIFSSAADRVGRVRGDEEILRFLAAHGYPAERVAHDRAVSVHDGNGVIVTDFIAGGRPTDDEGRTDVPEVMRELGSLLGRLHALPAAGGAVGRDGGAEETDGGFHVGRPKQDLAAAMSFLVGVEEQVAPEGRAGFELLRDLVEQADDAEGLPEALTHGNFHLWSAVGAPGDVTIVGWAGSGRGPRLPALAWLLRTAAEARIELVDDVMRGYAEHVRISDAEIARLPALLNLRPLWLACLDYREQVRSGSTPSTEAGWTPAWAVAEPEHVERLAERAVAAIRG